MIYFCKQLLLKSESQVESFERITFVKEISKLFKINFSHSVWNLIKTSLKRRVFCWYVQSYLLNSVRFPIKDLATSWSCHAACCFVRISLIYYSVNIRQLNKSWFVKIKKFKQSFQFSWLDSLSVILKNIYESPFEILLIYSSIKIFVKSFKCFFNWYFVWSYIISNLLNDFFFPIKSVASSWLRFRNTS